MYIHEPFNTQVERNARFHEARKEFADVVKYSNPIWQDTGYWKTVYFVAYPQPVINDVEELAAALEAKLGKEPEAAV